MDKYQEALERAKKGLPIDEVFPELKESEDEKIRKNLIELLLDTPAQDIISHHLELSKVLAYLERLKDIDCLACDQHLKGYIASRKVTEEEKQKEQVPAEWSDEDEKMLEHIISDLREFRDCETDEELVSDYEDEITWLKSRRPQPHWKPSEEQIDALKRVFYNRPIGSDELNSLESLYNDLKKL